MKNTSADRNKQFAFTLVELLIATTILSLLIVLLASLVGGINRAWVSGEQQVGAFQDGRAILGMISQDLVQGIISPKLQFVQKARLPGEANEREAADNLFWQTVSRGTDTGNVSEVGYYLDQQYRLLRFFVSPQDPEHRVFDEPPRSDAAPWTESVKRRASATLSEGVLALWVRCFDANGELIPWLSAVESSAAPLRFNSAARFQTATPLQPFKYTAASTQQAHLLPASVEVIFITLDQKTLLRAGSAIPSIPSTIPTGVTDVMPPGFGPEDVPSCVNWFNNRLIVENIRSARTFSGRIYLRNRGL